MLALQLATRGLVPRPPGAVEPTIDAIVALGLTCGGGLHDNVPSGLSQWHCNGSIDGMAGVGILVGGNDAGVSDIDVVTETDDVATSRAIAGRVVRSTPPLTSIDGLAIRLDDVLRAWDGRQLVAELDPLRISAACVPPSEFGDGQCMIHFVGPDALKPMLP